MAWRYAFETPQIFTAEFAEKFRRERRERLFGVEVVERFYGSELVVADIEDGVQFCDVQHVVHFLAEIQQLQLSTGIADGGEASDQLADSGAVNVIDLRQVEDDLLLAIGDESADSIAQLPNLVAQYDAPGDIQDRHVGDFAGIDG
jgi:hypothetical protein